LRKKVAPEFSTPDLHSRLDTVFWAQEKQADAKKEFKMAMEVS
jgi:hypothetical protein